MPRSDHPRSDTATPAEVPNTSPAPRRRAAKALRWSAVVLGALLGVIVLVIAASFAYPHVRGSVEQ